jgi:hypothetical protein
MPHSFTSKNSEKVRAIITEIHISEPLSDKTYKSNDKRLHRTTALWDTGATGSVITQQTAALLGLKPTSMTTVHHAGGVSIQNVYRVNIYLPNHVVIPNVRVTECPNTVGSFGVIIGMNIITMGDFALTNVGGATVVSFRMPSIEVIDYVEHERGIHIGPYKAEKAPERNAPCPCGSGKKYKNCCGKS